MISLVKKDYDSTKIYRKTHKKGASQTYDTPSPETVQLSVCVRYTFVTARVRHPVGLRSVPDQIASATRSDCVRYPIRLRPLHDGICRAKADTERLIMAGCVGMAGMPYPPMYHQNQ